MNVFNDIQRITIQFDWSIQAKISEILKADKEQEDSVVINMIRLQILNFSCKV